MSFLEQEAELDPPDQKPDKPASIPQSTPHITFNKDASLFPPSVDEIEKGDRITRRIFFGTTVVVTLGAVATTIGVSRWDKIKDYMDGKATLSEVFKINW